jgi:hypothetical protein
VAELVEMATLQVLTALQILAAVAVVLPVDLLEEEHQAEMVAQVWLF